MLQGFYHAHLMASALLKLLSDIKISHTVFAMPFALLGGFIAATNTGTLFWRQAIGQIAVIIACMFFARNAAMIANRILDREIDAKNPRTNNRAIACGEVKPTTAVLIYVCNSLLFICMCAIFILWDNYWPLILAVPILVWLSAYPYLKRFTWLCHVFLGASLAISPLAAAIAVQPESLSHVTIWLLSGAVLCWVAGFDIIYALQDIEVDVRDNLKSMPASLGQRPAMLISQLLHCLCVALLFGVSKTDPKFGWVFLVAIFFTAGLLVYEHITVKKWGTTKIALTFLTLNGIISLVLGTAGIIDLLM
jgi:4-hydroxybenzoate polyprenyltransferase